MSRPIHLIAPCLALGLLYAAPAAAQQKTRVTTSKTTKTRATPRTAKGPALRAPTLQQTFSTRALAAKRLNLPPREVQGPFTLSNKKPFLRQGRSTLQLTASRVSISSTSLTFQTYLEPMARQRGFQFGKMTLTMKGPVREHWRLVECAVHPLAVKAPVLRINSTQRTIKPSGRQIVQVILPPNTGKLTLQLTGANIPPHATFSVISCKVHVGRK